MSSAPARSSSSRTSGSRRSDHRFQLWALASTPSRGGRLRAFHGGAGSPQAAPQLRARPRLVPRPWLRPFPLSPPGVPGFPERDPRQPIESYASREHVASDASCRAPELTRTAPGSPKGARAPSTCHAPTCQAFKVRSAFLRQVPATSHLAGARCAAFLSRHWCLRFAASAQLPTCVHARLSRARPTTQRLLPRECMSHMLPIEFCSRKDPRAHLGAFQTPTAWRMSKPIPDGWRHPLRGHTN